MRLNSVTVLSSLTQQLAHGKGQSELRLSLPSMPKGMFELEHSTKMDLGLLTETSSSLRSVDQDCFLGAVFHVGGVPDKYF